MRSPIDIAPGVTILGKHYAPDNGVFILHHNGQAILVECPPDDAWPIDAVKFLHAHDLELVGITTSHLHNDHYDLDALDSFARLMDVSIEELPWWQSNDKRLADWAYYESDIGGEPLWAISCAKHSRSDQVLVFKGVALTGDIELGMQESVNDEVSAYERAQALHFLANFEKAFDYKIHSLCSAHANDLRHDVDWVKVVLPTTPMKFQPRPLGSRVMASRPTSGSLPPYGRP